LASTGRAEKLLRYGKSLYVKLEGGFTNFIQGADNADPDFQALKKSITDSIAREQYDTFTSFIAAAKAGDVEMIRDLLRCGAEIDAVNYDGRTAFSMVVSHAILWRFGISRIDSAAPRHAMRVASKLWSCSWKKAWIKTRRTDGTKHLLMKP
jgi:hypothetical protein